MPSVTPPPRSDRLGTAALSHAPLKFCPDPPMGLVTAEMDEVADPVVGGEKTLCLACRLEALHLPFSSSCRLVGVLGPVVETLVPAVLDARPQLFLAAP